MVVRCGAFAALWMSMFLRVVSSLVDECGRLLGVHVHTGLCDPLPDLLIQLLEHV